MDTSGGEWVKRVFVTTDGKNSRNEVVEAEMGTLMKKSLLSPFWRSGWNCGVCLGVMVDCQSPLCDGHWIRQSRSWSSLLRIGSGICSVKRLLRNDERQSECVGVEQLPGSSFCCPERGDDVIHKSSLEWDLWITEVRVSRSWFVEIILFCCSWEMNAIGERVSALVHCDGRGVTDIPDVNTMNVMKIPSEWEGKRWCMSIPLSLLTEFLNVCWMTALSQ